MSDDVYEIECLVVGAGVVGLACAAAIARLGHDVLVVEAASAIGTGVSARNSEVIHAGIYYPTNSVRRRLCVEGRRKLYAYAASHNVAHRKCGKLIVATAAAEEAQIAALHQRALDNDVEGMSLLTGAEARALEPNLNCVAAAFSTETGIVDAHGLMTALRGDLESAGGAVALNAPVLGGAMRDGGDFEIRVGGAQPALARCRVLINAASLQAQRVAASIEGMPAAHIPPLTLVKGNYFGCAGRPAFSRLIYPAPVEGGLGVHLTLDLGGRMRFGPDVEWLAVNDPDSVDYTVDPRRGDAFYAAIRRYWPALADGALTPDYSGCRPKLSGPGQTAADFRIDGAEVHGVRGLVNLFGIESPGLTSSLAIAEDVAAKALAS
ncbi:MAG: NAD(P)/FAD-dependent oxidoreductase [Terricaulis sp.]